MLSKVLTGKLTFSSLKPCDLSNTNRSEIREYFENSYDLNESIFTALKDESVFYTAPDRLRLPLIFYYGHTACVYVNKLILADLLQPEDRINLEYDSMFETGVDEMSWDDTENYRMGGKFQWPALDDVIEYRRQIRKLVLRVIDEVPLDLPITSDTPLWTLFLGMEHERIHLETSSVLIRQLPVELLQRPLAFAYGPVKGPCPAGENILIKAPASKVTLGKPKDFPSFGWDNEYGSATYQVPEFEASRYLVTNREFLDFVKSGGYCRKELWSAEGWEWREFRQAIHPTFWVCTQGCKNGSAESLSSYVHCKCASASSNTSPSRADFIPQEEVAVNHMTNGHNAYCNGHSNVDGNGHQGSDEGGGHMEYKFRCLYDVIDMPWDWPVEVNYHEAKAFCAWKGPDYRMPSEAEHHVLRGTVKDPKVGTDCDIIYHNNPEANLNFKFGSSTPVNLFKPTELGFYDVFGNVWEWMEDHFNGLPGFKTVSVYDDFSSPCFDGRHNEILGGSWISTGDEASRFARFAFRRHFFQHCGFRLVRNITNKGEMLPVRVVNTPIYISKGGVIDNSIADEAEVAAGPSMYCHYTQDNEQALQEQLYLEYGPTPQLQPFSDKVLSVVERHQADCSRALHLGCGVGSVSFQIQHLFTRMLAIDISARFIDVCQNLQNGKSVSLTLGRQMQTINPPQNLENGNLIFKQLSWLPNEVGFFTFVLATMFDRVQNVSAWTVRFKEVIKPGGLLVVCSDKWNQNSLAPLIEKYFQFVESDELSIHGEQTTGQAVSVWRRG